MKMVEIQYEIKEGKTLIDITHEDKIITFMYKRYGPGYYADVAGSIEKAGLVKPTMAETVSLVHTAFLVGGEEFSQIKQVMNNEGFWGFTGILYVPNKGAYIQDNPEIRNGELYMKESDLIKKLDAGDTSVRLEHFGFKTEKMTPAELEENRFIIALVGKEGAEKLAEIARKHKYNLCLWSRKYVNQPLTAVSTLGFIPVSGTGRLDIGGFSQGYGPITSCAFGIQKTGEASHAK